MLTKADRQIVREFQRRLADIAPVLDLRVFGSRARGEAAPDSDLDVFIELEKCTPELRQRISEIAWEVGFEMEGQHFSAGPPSAYCIPTSVTTLTRRPGT